MWNYSDEESEHDEWLSATTPQHSEDGITQEEFDQPLLVHTTPVVGLQPNALNLEREETTKIDRFLADGDMASGFCSNTFTAEYIHSYRCQCSELTRTELDMALLGQLAAFVNSSPITSHSTKHRHTLASRQRSYMLYFHGGKRVCRKTFLFLHTISEKRLRNLQESLRENGVAPRRHGNTQRLPANTISFADTQRVVQYLHSYAEASAILLPGRIPGYKRTDVQLLPSSTTKRQVWLQYCASLQSPQYKVAYSTFSSL